MKKIKARVLAIASLEILFGICAGVIILELVLGLNPKLLIQGMDTPLPVSPGVTNLKYSVRYSDGDLFFWQVGLIAPVEEHQDKIETYVNYWSDELGFPNYPPGIIDAEIVVLGRSYSMGAQASAPWPLQLEKKSGLGVLNLSQTGSGLFRKEDYLNRIGKPLKPQWVVLEVLPSLDIYEYSADQGWLVKATINPLLKSVFHNDIEKSKAVSTDPVFPLEISIGEQKIEYLDYLLYISSLTLPKDVLLMSHNYSDFVDGLSGLAAGAADFGACVVLLYVPTKSEIMFPLLTRKEELLPLLPLLYSWDLNEQMNLNITDRKVQESSMLIINAQEVSQVVEALARETKLDWVDPSQELRQAILNGSNPYLQYDTHWNDLGHEIVANQILRTITNTRCPYANR